MLLARIYGKDNLITSEVFSITRYSNRRDNMPDTLILCQKLHENSWCLVQAKLKQGDLRLCWKCFPLRTTFSFYEGRSGAVEFIIDVWALLATLYIHSCVGLSCRVQGFNLTACLHLAHSQWCTWVLVLQECLLAHLHIHNWSGFLSCMPGHKKACLNTLHITLTNTWFLCMCKVVTRFTNLLAPLCIHNCAWILGCLQWCKKSYLHLWRWCTIGYGFCIMCKAARRLAYLALSQLRKDFVLCVRFQEGLLAPCMLTKVQGSCVPSVQGSIIWLAWTFPYS